MNAGAINFLIKRFDEQPVLESDLPQITAGVFQADDGHGGIAGDFARGVRAHACARFGLLAPHACRPAVSGVYPRTSASRHERPFAYHISGEACSWLGLLWLGTRESLHVLHPAGGCDIARDPANWPPTGSESRHIGQGRCGGIQSPSIRCALPSCAISPDQLNTSIGRGARHAFVPRQTVQESCRKANGKGDSGGSSDSSSSTAIRPSQPPGRTSRSRSSSPSRHPARFDSCRVRPCRT